MTASLEPLGLPLGTPFLNTHGYRFICKYLLMMMVCMVHGALQFHINGDSADDDAGDDSAYGARCTSISH